MKILFLSDGLYPFQLGGMQKHSSILIRLLAERNIHVTVIHNGGENCNDETLATEFPNQSCINFIQIPFPKFRKFPGHYIRENIAYSRAAHNVVKQNFSEFELVYAQGFTAHAFLENKEKAEKCIPIITNLHGIEMFQFSANLRSKIANILLRKEAQFVLTKSDYVYSFGARITDLLLKIKIPQHKILVQSNGIEQHWLSNAPKLNKVRNFIFIGRTERRKGFIEFLEAVQRLSQNTELDFHVHHVGPVVEKHRQMPERITWHGEIRDTEKIKSILDECDCIVVPSFAEGMPTVILEAMARGLAVIATDVGAVSRTLFENGILLIHPNPDLIYKAMLKVIEMTEEKLTQMKLNSLQLIREKFLWSEVVDTKIADFQKIIRQIN